MAILNRLASVTPIPTVRLLIILLAVLLPFSASDRLTADDGPGTPDPTERFIANNAVLKIMEQRKVPCRASGVISASSLSEGVLVKQGQIVMTIDDRIAQLEVERLSKELAKTEKEASTRVELEFQRRSIEVAKAELNRALLSNQRQPGSVARSEVDQLNLMVQRAIAEKDKTEFQIEVRNMTSEVKRVELAIGKQKVEQHQIVSPISGMVVEVLKREGEWVEASEPVCRVVRLDKLKTEVKVPAAIALDNLVGSQAEFVPDLKSLNKKAYAARVIFVDPEANPVNASVKVWVEIDNPDLDLVGGLTGQLKIK